MIPQPQVVALVNWWSSAGQAGGVAIAAAPGQIVRRCVRLVPLLTATLALAGCDALKLGVMNHAGPVAAAQWHLYLIVGAVLVFVAGPVLLITPIMAWHYRLSNRQNTYTPDWAFSWPLEGLIWIPPTGIVIGLGFLLWNYTQDLDPYRRLAGDGPPVEVQAVALDWKWLFIYPDHRVAAVNQLAIPVGRPVHLTLTSGTVMQSLLIPRLGGQIYAMAGMKTELNLAASQAGVFGGANTQFNGAGFQAQRFDVVALPPAEYRRWLERVRASAHPLDDAQYARLFTRTLEPRPVYFSTVPSDLFGRIMTTAQAPTR